PPLPPRRRASQRDPADRASCHFPSAVFIAPHSATVGKNAGLFNRALPISPIGGNDSPLTAVRRDANPFRTAALHNSRPARPARAARRTDTRARFPAVSARKD